MRGWGAMRRGVPESLVFYALPDIAITKEYGGSAPPCTVAEVAQRYKKHIPAGSNHRLDVYHSDGEQCYLNLPEHVGLTKKQLHTQVVHTPMKSKSGMPRRVHEAEEAQAEERPDCLRVGRDPGGGRPVGASAKARARGVSGS